MTELQQKVNQALESFDDEFSTTIIANRLSELFPEFPNQNFPYGKRLIGDALLKLKKKNLIEIARRDEKGNRGDSVIFYRKTTKK